MLTLLDRDTVDLDRYADLRHAVRAFLASELAREGLSRKLGSWSAYDRGFSRRLAARGWVGMAIPRRYSGHEKSLLERYVVLEELLAAGAPVASHWVADRQSAPLLLGFGTEEQRATFLPLIAAAEISFAIGMSEPDSGSDLAGLHSRAVKVEGGWSLTGRKVWSTNAHRAEFMIVLCRTGDAGADRHGGLTQLIVDLRDAKVSVSPIRDLAGGAEFNEVVFDALFVPDARVVGEVGGGWRQVMSELAFERSGPERFLSSFRLLVEGLRAVGPRPDRYAAVAFGRLIARLGAVRQVSMQVAALLDEGATPDTEASLVKDYGTAVEQETAEVVRLVLGSGAGGDASGLLEALLAHDVQHAATFSIRGGTREVMRGIIARGLGLR